jgi:hypothetical protein
VHSGRRNHAAGNNRRQTDESQETAMMECATSS